ncbi:4-alpha-glucanotransferase [Sphingomonas jeddahensis]|uniref:4-alpha-glucanotransferase n=1 Tax=Sphingomonas jeddahensis TaxID=1915074 RepID=UPI001E59F554|nr:4-alpha-glucanotransferase [Sphingomonas jeddahensis]
MLEALLACLDLTPPETPFLSITAGEPVHLPGAPTGTADLTLEDGTAIPLALGQDTITQIGYHHLQLGRRSYTIAVAPARCPQPPGRGWGLAIQIPSLRDDHPTAYGSYATLAKAAAAFGRSGATALAISPTHALFPADPTRFSPYAPSSRLFHNVALADPSLIGMPFPTEPAPDLIDWPDAQRFRLKHLRFAFESAGPEIEAAVSAYAAQHGPPLIDHARFDALQWHMNVRAGSHWPTELRDPASPAVQRFAAEHAQDVAFFTFLQWLADQGLANAQKSAREHMAIGLIADLAVGTDRGGSHGWSDPRDLLTGVTIGAPPDPLGPDGQNWGISALDPFALARSGFAPFINTIRTALRHAGGLRIDHAIGLDRLWIVPDHATAADGAYLDMPGETLKNIVAIEARRAGAIVIAEDLGTVPPGLREDLSRRGMLGMRVLPFERDKQGGFVSAAQWDSDAVAMTGTHDTPTVVGWWKGRDVEWRAAISGQPANLEERTKERNSLAQALDVSGTAPEEPPLDQVLEAVAGSPAPLAIFPLEDLLGIEEQPNLPGTVDEHPNWRRRMPDNTAALLARPAVAQRTHILTAKRPG